MVTPVTIRTITMQLPTHSKFSLISLDTIFIPYTSSYTIVHVRTFIILLLYNDSITAKLPTLYNLG